MASSKFLKFRPVHYIEYREPHFQGIEKFQPPGVVLSGIYYMEWGLFQLRGFEIAKVMDEIDEIMMQRTLLTRI
jgi:hypothetical protein